MLEREGREEGAERTGRFGSVVVVGAETTAPPHGQGRGLAPPGARGASAIARTQSRVRGWGWVRR